MRVAVLGGGLQGCGVALELAQRGHRVELYERGSRLMGAASLHNEGKVHLGYVYSADTSLRTADLMMRGAAVFESTLRRWVAVDDALRASQPFRYAVLRSSIVDPEELGRTYARIAERVRATVGGLPYFTAHDVGLLHRLPSSQMGDFSDEVVAAYETAEVAVDPALLAGGVAAAVADAEHVDVHLGTRVLAVRPAARAVVVESADGARTAGGFDHIVNCTWSDLLFLDASAGLEPVRPWSFRYKCFVRLDLAAPALDLPSVTMALGPFGDLVRFTSSSYYLSWYPAGRRDFSTELRPSEQPSVLSRAAAEVLARRIVEGVAGVVPGAAGAASEHLAECFVGGGVIYARGDTEIDQLASGLHQRHAIGVRTTGCYHSIDTGKLTTAPLFAVEAAERMEAIGRA